MEMPFENPCPGQAKGLSSYYFNQVVHMLLASHCLLGNPDDYPKDYGNSLNNSQEFDFVIVGGGSAGSVVANRLSENKNWNVLLLEAGDNPTFESDIPGFGLSLPGRSLDWKFTTNQSGYSCLGMEEETCAIFQGKVLGGTSTINKMHYLRGNPQDFNEWERLGNQGWGFDKILKYFKKSEKLDEEFQIVSDSEYWDLYRRIKKKARSAKDLHEASKLVSGKYHSKAGMLSVNHFTYDIGLLSLKNKIFAAAEELGLLHLGDANWKYDVGYFQAMGVIHEGNRGNTAKAFLTPAKKRKNLFVVRNATAKSLVIEGTRVLGVKYSHNGKLKNVVAKKEVILSAGSINTPKLLMLSGIGEEKHLKQFNIKVVKDLPGVGKNLQAHLSFFGLPFFINRDNSKPITHLQKIDAMYQFISRGIGSFGNLGLNDIVGFISTKKNDTLPDIQLLHYLNHIRDYYTFNELLISLKVKNEIRDQFSKAYAKSNVLLVSPTLLRPKSRGFVELTGNTFDNPPKIVSNYLTEKNDVTALLKGINFVLNFMQTESMKKFKPELLKLKIEGCSQVEWNENKFWECLIRHMTSSMDEIAGTCKMGLQEDPLAVVDNRLRVYGLKGLRVVDSSIMPVIVTGSCSVTSIMIGEKGSDMIKEDWNKVKHTEL